MTSAHSCSHIEVARFPECYRAPGQCALRRGQDDRIHGADRQVDSTRAASRVGVGGKILGSNSDYLRAMVPLGVGYAGSGRTTDLADGFRYSPRNLGEGASRRRSLLALLRRLCGFLNRSSDLLSYRGNSEVAVPEKPWLNPRKASSREVGCGEDEGERYPRSQGAGEHGETPLEERRHQAGIPPVGSAVRMRNRGPDGLPV